MSGSTPHKNKGSKKSDKPKKDDISESDISYDGQEKCVKEKRYVTEAQLSEMERVMEARINTLMSVIDKKEKTISDLSIKVGRLESEVEHLKKCSNFLTNETTEMKKEADSLRKGTEEMTSKINTIADKTVDLEDRSRRDNIVVFGIPEESEEGPQRSEELLVDLFKARGLINPRHDNEHDPVFHRVHRLGPRKSDAQKPRPIIAKCVYYKDREQFIKNSFKLKGTSVNISEDFSKQTLDVRRKLVECAKTAKEVNEDFTSFRINYKRLVVKYVNRNTNQTFFRGFNLNQVLETNNWHVITPHSRPTYSNTYSNINSNTTNGYQG